MNCYRTIRETDDSVETLYEIQKSRFITHIRHVETGERGPQLHQAMKKQYFDARHNCSAYVLGERADKQKSNDGGPAARQAIHPRGHQENELTDVVIVVTLLRRPQAQRGQAHPRLQPCRRARASSGHAHRDDAVHRALHVTIGYDLLARSSTGSASRITRRKPTTPARHAPSLAATREVEARLTAPRLLRAPTSSREGRDTPHRPAVLTSRESISLTKETVFPYNISYTYLNDMSLKDLLILPIRRDSMNDYTLEVHGCHKYDATGAISEPIYLSATYRHPGYKQSTGFDYGRVANPTRKELEDVLAKLERGQRAWAVSSGMARHQHGAHLPIKRPSAL